MRGHRAGSRFFRPFRVIATGREEAFYAKLFELRGAYATEVGKDINSSRYVI